MDNAGQQPNLDLEKIPEGEAAQIDETVRLMGEILDRRYMGKERFLRGVHPKDHGCVEATFTISDAIPPEYRTGVFSNAGETFRAAIRFSNAAPVVAPDTPQDVGPSMGDPVTGPDGKPVLVHGSRGMAIKLFDVSGSRLLPEDGERTQDFLMINQPVFAFANAEDYKALNEAILADEKFAFRFFGRMASADQAVQARAKRSLEIIQSVKNLRGAPPIFQLPPLSPLDNSYFSAAPFSLGDRRVMKFSARPVAPVSGDLDPAVFADPDYLRKALNKRMIEADGKDICFDFELQVREVENLGNIELDIEDACTLWPEPFTTVARITIPVQDITTPERQQFCEALFFTPWHGLTEHRPLGGINRLRRKIYEISADRRGCPVSPDLPG
jgi:hypothetical protein